MSFQFYTNMVQGASRAFSRGLLVVGLLLVGFGLLVYWLRQIFAFIAAAIFVFVGLSCIGTAARIFFSQRRFNKMAGGPDVTHRENVRIHVEEHYDI